MSKRTQTKPPMGAELAEHRSRMQLVGDLLNAALVDLIGSSRGADRAGRAAYLHIIGQVFEALHGLSQAVPLDDLVKLSKVVAEQRRAEQSARKVESADGSTAVAAAGSGVRRVVENHDGARGGEGARAKRRLPANFGTVVQEIYGASLAGDAPGAEQTEEDNASEAGG